MSTFIFSKRPLYGSFYLAAFVPVALIVWLVRKLPLAVTSLKDLRHRAGHIPRFLDLTKLAAVTTALHHAITEGICPIPSLWLPPDESSDSEWESDDDDDEMDNQHLRYPLIQSLVIGAPGTSLFVSWFKRLLQVLRRSVFGDATEDGGLYRLSDVRHDPWNLHTGAANFTGPCDLTNASTGTWLQKLKITTTLVIFIWQELQQQNWKSCEGQAERCFTEVAGQSVDNLLAVASSFSNASWCDGHISPLLTVFEALVDVLFNIQKLSLKISVDIAGIFDKMVNAFKEVIQEATNDTHSCTESTIHPATHVLTRVLDFFCRNRVMVENIYGSDPCSDMFYYWVPKLDKGAENYFQEEGRRCLFVLNNIYYVLQVNCHPGLLPNAENDPLIKKYIVSYLDEYWSPRLLSYLNVPHRSSLDKFITEFNSISDRQMTWRVQTELKKTLREEIVKRICLKYQDFLEALQANPSSCWPYQLKGMRGRSENWEYSVDQLAKAIRELFEL